jgi:hypothetical protein
VDPGTRLLPLQARTPEAVGRRDGRYLQSQRNAIGAPDARNYAATGQILRSHSSTSAASWQALDRILSAPHQIAVPATDRNTHPRCHYRTDQIAIAAAEEFLELLTDARLRSPSDCGKRAHDISQPIDAAINHLMFKVSKRGISSSSSRHCPRILRCGQPSSTKRQEVLSPGRMRRARKRPSGLRLSGPN